MRGILSYLRQQQAPSKFAKFGAAQTAFIRHSAVRRHAVDYAPEMLAKLRQEVVGAIPDWRDSFLHLILAENRLQLPCETA